MTDTREFLDGHGIAIVYDVHPAAATPRGVVQLLHGVGEHAGRYPALVRSLTEAGFIVYADDHRGHGRTGIRQHGGPARLGRLGPGGLRAAEDAIWRLTEIIRAENPDLPLVLLGHSWGSILAQKLVNHHPEAYDGVILSASALMTPTSVNAGPLNARWAKVEGVTGLEWLSRDPAVGVAFSDDPLTTDVPVAKLFGVIEGLKLYGRPARDLFSSEGGHDIPVLLLVGRDDPMGGPRSVHRLADEYRTRSGFTDVTTLVYPDARHEIFNELQQDEVRADVLSWLDRRIPSRG